MRNIKQAYNTACYQPGGKRIELSDCIKLLPLNGETLHPSCHGEIRLFGVHSMNVFVIVH